MPNMVTKRTAGAPGGTSRGGSGRRSPREDFRVNGQGGPSALTALAHSVPSSRRAALVGCGS
eukprot:2501733-Alexandrium_andersonii.AAC.1